MKKKILVLMLVFLLIAVNLYAADGDFIIEGKVGIGTDTPVRELHILGLHPRVHIESIDNDGFPGFNFKNGQREWYVRINGMGDSFQIIDETIGQSRLVITTSGNVGIGTMTPTEKLEVAGAIRVADTTSSCDSAHEGTIKYVRPHFYGCDGSTWKQLD